MFTLDISTPGLLFPAISLLLLAYTNRFLSTGQLVRDLAANARDRKCNFLKEQIKNLKNRMELIRVMQIFGLFSLLFCVISMVLLFLKYDNIGMLNFILSLLTMGISLILAIIEVWISNIALRFELKGLENNSVD